jgi:hypothetical protein
MTLIEEQKAILVTVEWKGFFCKNWIALQDSELQPEAVFYHFDKTEEFAAILF